MPRVIHGCNEVQVKAGVAVRLVAKSLRDILNVTDDAIALVNGEHVGFDCVLAEEDNLEFVSEFGQKGLGNLLTAQDLIERWKITEEKYHEMLERGLPTLSFRNGSAVHPEGAVDDWLRRITVAEPEASALARALRRIADHFDPPPPDKVGSDYIAQRLGCTTTWIADLVRRGEIPQSCVVPGTGNGKPWKFFREQIDRWIESR